MLTYLYLRLWTNLNFFFSILERLFINDSLFIGFCSAEGNSFHLKINQLYAFLVYPSSSIIVIYPFSTLKKQILHNDQYVLLIVEE